MAAIKVKDESEFRSLLDGLSRDIVDAHIYWKLWKDIDELLKASPEVYNESSTFWYYTLNAYLRTALASLARAFDQEESSLHLKSWLITIREHQYLFTKSAFARRCSGDPFAKWLLKDAKEPDIAVLAADIGSCSMTDPDVSALYKYRSTVVAHRGAKLTKQGANAQFPNIDVELIERLLERASAILNRYSMLFNATAYGMTPVGHDDVKRVVRSVQRDLTDARERVEAQVAALVGKQQ
ncbi:hypothetical protein [Paraburkholderia sp. J41]|uniref:AbiU2 domain-containing protein n=1 Tax=Paraburkholderia sp. J41 TaxID=2805433 RepID=UPI002AC31C17|nr:hypothetical protein [Paraburkholderia sp. J41]